MLSVGQKITFENGDRVFGETYGEIINCNNIIQTKFGLGVLTGNLYVKNIYFDWKRLNP